MTYCKVNNRFRVYWLKSRLCKRLHTSHPTSVLPTAAWDQTLGYVFLSRPIAINLLALSCRLQSIDAPAPFHNALTTCTTSSCIMFTHSRHCHDSSAAVYLTLPTTFITKAGAASPSLPDRANYFVLLQPHRRAELRSKASPSSATSIHWVQIAEETSRSR